MLLVVVSEVIISGIDTRSTIISGFIVIVIRLTIIIIVTFINITISEHKLLH